MTQHDRRTFAFESRSVTLETTAVSHVGMVRRVNEDSFACTGGTFLVADGMGGHAHGDRASQTIAAEFTARLSTNDLVTADTVRSAIVSANAAVRALSESGASDAAVAGSTLAGGSLVRLDNETEPCWMIFNVGDSRVYSWQDHRLSQVTTDHSAVQELIDAGVISRDEGERHPDRNVVTRALGVDDQVDVDVWLLPLGGRQIFIACSDGLTKELSDDDIGEILNECDATDAFDAAAGRLVNAAVKAGGADNITVVVAMSQWHENAVDAVPSSLVPAFLEDTVPRR